MVQISEGGGNSQMLEIRHDRPTVRSTFRNHAPHSSASSTPIDTLTLSGVFSARLYRVAATQPLPPSHILITS